MQTFLIRDILLAMTEFLFASVSQATYVLLALAWVFVPVYISSGVSMNMNVCLLVKAGSAGTFWCQQAFPLQAFPALKIPQHVVTVESTQLSSNICSVGL